MRTDKGKLIVISGPSGAGKSTVIAKVMAGREDLCFSVSATTRPPRQGEVDGKDYYFIDRTYFEEKISQGAFLEHTEYVGNLYGTPAAPVRACLERGVSVVLDIEVEGAGNVRRTMPEAITVFLTPPSFSALEERLRARGKDSEDKIRLRLATARREYARVGEYDYIVINDDPDVAAEELRSIITAEKCRTADRIDFIAKD